ncbi:hypothetical protein ZTR_10437 [Talaromyces verruculosus]|nr:hypothetical protein ZTR_10437 [Talaromyces verruculosus]
MLDEFSQKVRRHGQAWTDEIRKLREELEILQDQNSRLQEQITTANGEKDRLREELIMSNHERDRLRDESTISNQQNDEKIRDLQRVVDERTNFTSLACQGCGEGKKYWRSKRESPSLSSPLVIPIIKEKAAAITIIYVKMSSAPAPIFAPGPVGFVLPGGFDLSIDLDFLPGWCDCLEPLAREIQRVIQEYRAMGQGNERPAIWLVDYREIFGSYILRRWMESLSSRPTLRLA